MADSDLSLWIDKYEYAEGNGSNDEAVKVDELHDVQALAALDDAISGERY